MKNLFLLAVQGAGKGTVSQALVEKYGYEHVSTGDLLRERRKINDEIGRIIAETQDAGNLTPVEIVCQVFEEKILTCDKGFILDGIPRSLEQAIKVDEILKRINKEVDLVINLTVADEILIERITNRRNCGNCGKIYNLTFQDMMPKTDGKCDDCDGELILRNDDADVTAIQKRIDIYHENADVLLNHYKDKLVNVDCTTSKAAIAEIEKLIKE